MIFVNGWNLGQYIAGVGPQHTFVLPTGILNPRGHNTIALAVTSDGGPANALERISLTTSAPSSAGGRSSRWARLPLLSDLRRHGL